MKKNINKSTVVFALLSLVLLHLPNVCAVWLEEAEEKSILLPTWEHNEKNRHRAVRFWGLVKAQLGDKPYPLPDLEDKEVILVLGETGVGKSTFINRMLGHKFNWIYKQQVTKSIKKKPFVSCKKDLEALLAEESSDDEVIEKVLTMVNTKPNTPVSPIGDNMFSSCTKVPQVYRLTAKIVLVDCPGFGDSDGVEQEILNLLMIRLFVKKAAKINAIMALFPYSVFQDSGKGNHFLMLARQLDYLLQFGNCIGNILWCFTKCPENTKRQSIVQKIASMQQEKASFRDKIPTTLWDKSPEKKDMILLGKMLEKTYMVRVVSPLCVDDQVEKLKRILTLMNEKSIDKAYFDFYHPKIDISGIVKRFFSVKRDILSDYEAYQAIPASIAKIDQEIRDNQTILDVPDQLKNYIKNKTQQIKQDIEILQKEMDDLTKKGEESLPYRSIKVNLSARWLNDSKTIIYDDLPFEENDLKEAYDQRKVIKKEHYSCPGSGTYVATFTLLGKKDYYKKVGVSVTSALALGTTAYSKLPPIVPNVITYAKTVVPATLGTAATVTGSLAVAGVVVYTFMHKEKATVEMNFYVKRKHIDPIAPKQDKLKEQQTDLKKKIENVNTSTSISAIKAFLKNQCEQILPQQKERLECLQKCEKYKNT